MHNIDTAKYVGSAKVNLPDVYARGFPDILRWAVKSSIGTHRCSKVLRCRDIARNVFYSSGCELDKGLKTKSQQRTHGY